MRRFLTLALALLLAAPVAAQSPHPLCTGSIENFDGPTLGPEWILEAGTVYGTVDRYRTTATVESTIDLASSPGRLLMQNSRSGEDKVRLDQRLPLADLEGYLCEFNLSTSGAENAYAVGISAHAETANPPVSGEWFQVFADAEYQRHGYRMLVVVTNRVHLNATSQNDGTYNPSANLLLWLERNDAAAAAPGVNVGGTGTVGYHGWYSRDDGRAWSHVGSRRFAEPFDRIGIFNRIGSGATQSANWYTPIEVANWCCRTGGAAE